MTAVSQPLLILDQRYRKPERYKAVPEGKLLYPFGLNITPSGISYNRGVFFGRKGKLCYDIYSPIEADSFYLDSEKGILYLTDSRIGLQIRIYGVRTFQTPLNNKPIKRGTYLGNAHQIKDCRPGVYIECVILSENLIDSLRGRYLQSEGRIEAILAERFYIKQCSSVYGLRYCESKHLTRCMKKKERVSEITPYWIIQRPARYKPYEVYFNYSALFC